MPNSTQNQVKSRVKRKGAGAVFVTKDFLDLGSRAAVDQALSRLVKDGTLRSLASGIFYAPRIHPVLGELMPSPDDVAQALARKSDSKVQVSGARAVNLLGLSTQVPARQVYLTDGPDKTLMLGNQEIVLRHVSTKNLVDDKTPGLVVQALRYIGKENIGDDTIQRLRSILSDKDKQALKKVAPKTVAWVKPLVEQIAA